MFDATAPAGFPSPAEGYTQRPIDLNEWLVKNPSSTFMFRVAGQSMIGADIHDGDWVIVDRSVEALDGDIVLAEIDGEFTVKTFRRTRSRVWLQPENSAFPSIETSEEHDGLVWGVLQSGIRIFSRQHRKRVS